MTCNICSDKDLGGNGLYTALADDEFYICELCRVHRHLDMLKLGLKHYVLLKPSSARYDVV